jgi:cysteine desulfurase family protein
MGTAKRVYLDNAATSFPKPPAVGAAMAAFTTSIGASPGRGAYDESLQASAHLNATRSALAQLLHVSDARRIVFTLNCTDALFLAIHGVARHWLRRGERVHMITTAMDHNSVLRPLNDLKQDGITFTRIDGDPDSGLIDPDTLAAACTPWTRLACVNHGSNVSGTVQDIEAIGDRCRSKGVPLLVDAAQTAGHRPLDPAQSGIDLLAMPGHKGLLGPLGTGALWLGPGMTQIVDPIRTGGTGSLSEADVHPDMLPDRYEAGSHNTVGLTGLGAALDWLEARTVQAIHEHETKVGGRLLEGLLQIDDLHVLGPRSMTNRCGVFSVHTPAMTPAALADALERRHGVLARPGLHCAPHAHRTFGTLTAGGTTRLSVGYATSLEDVELAIEAVADVHHSARRSGAAILTP